MAMFKASCAYAGSWQDATEQGCWTACTRRLYPLKTSNMFITAGFLAGAHGRLSLSLAGHPALLHFQQANGRCMRICSWPDLPYRNSSRPEFLDRERSIVNQATFCCCSPTESWKLPTGLATELGIDPVKSALRNGPDLPLTGKCSEDTRAGPGVWQARRRSDDAPGAAIELGSVVDGKNGRK